jgi:hypothetical protein
MKYIIIIYFLFSLITINSISIYIFIKHNENKKKRYLSNSIEDKKKEYLKYKRNITNSFNKLQKKFKEQLFDGEVNYILDETKPKIGLMTMRIIFPNDRNILFVEEYPTFIIKILENKTVENSIFISIIHNIANYFVLLNPENKLSKNITLYSYNDSSLHISYNSDIEKAHYFNTPYSKKFCNIHYNLNFIQKKDTFSYMIEVIGIKGTLYSDECNIKMDFDLKKHSNIKSELYNTIAFYCIVNSLLSLFYLINMKSFITKINDTLMNQKSICIFTICQNIIWNSYCCYCHFFFVVKFIEFKLFFMIVCSLYFFNAGFIEFPLLYKLLCLKYYHLVNDTLNYRKQIIRFCFILYLLILFSFLFVAKFYYSPSFICFNFIMIWFPQIIFNIYYKNRISFPILYDISIIMNRIFPSVYFNFVKNNFLRIPNNRKYIEIMNISILLILTIFLYSQTLFGSRWFLPFLLVKEYNFYIDEEDLKKIKKNDIYNLECFICLSEIIPKQKRNNNINNNYSSDNNSGFNETDNLVEINEKSLGKLELNNKCKCIEKYFGNKSILFNFHEYSKNIFNKPFMITPCNHVFHSECLEEWFKMKKECPNCRTIITADMYN